MVTSFQQRFTDPIRAGDPQQLLTTLQNLRESVLAEGAAILDRWRSRLERSDFRPSALNLAHYLALRQHDLRSLQTALMPWGLSSLGRIESRVKPNLDAVVATLGHLCGVDAANLPTHPPLEAFFEGDRLLRQHTQAVFGSAHGIRTVRIMVTLPTEAATDYDLVQTLLQRGTDCVRINCAHDDVEQWQAMIDHVRRAVVATGQPCKILMDLGGPKPRTDQILLPDLKRRLFASDRLLLTFGEPHPHLSYPIQASVTLPEVLTDLNVGETVWLDDGHVGAVVDSIHEAGVLLRVTHARPGGEKLRSQKGLNFPESDVHMHALTDKDRQDLDFVATHADIVGYSFVQEAADIAQLQQELRDRLPASVPPPAIVAKIETPKAVHNLPDLTVQAAGQQPFGVMIARGDLAVELGYQRLVEMQEEILWLCQAAHIPVIWATQVLENYVKKGNLSRSEMTDAAMAERAECVMLNKGPFLAEAVTLLDDVLVRMQAHQVKKTPQLRALHAWLAEVEPSC